MDIICKIPLKSLSDRKLRFSLFLRNIIFKLFLFNISFKVRLYEGADKVIRAVCKNIGANATWLNFSFLAGSSTTQVCCLVETRTAQGN